MRFWDWAGVWVPRLTPVTLPLGETHGSPAPQLWAGCSWSESRRRAGVGEATRLPLARVPSDFCWHRELRPPRPPP